MSNKYEIATTFNLIDKVTEPLNKITGVTNEMGKGIKKSFYKAQLQVDDFGKQIEKATGFMKKAAVAAAAAGAAAAGAFVVQGVKGAVEFQKSMEKVGAQANLTGDQIKRFSNDIINLSSNLGNSVQDLAAAQLEAISHGIKAADSVKFVEVATRAAAGGFSDTTKVISGLTSVLKSYGLEASEAEKVSDQMMAAARLGGVSFEDMATKLERVIPTAAQFGVTSDELFASVSALTSQGVPIEAAAKQIKSTLEKSGKKGLFNLAPGEKFNDMLHKISNSAGATKIAYERVDATLGNQWQTTLNKIKNVGLKLGTALLPAFQKIIDKVALFAEKFTELDFSPFVSKIEGALDRIIASIDFDKFVNSMGGFFTAISETANCIISLVEGIWKLKKPIAAVIAAISLFKIVMLALAVVEKVVAGVKAIITGASYAYLIVVKKQTQALTFLTAETKGVKIATELWALVMKGWQGVKFVANLIKEGVVKAALAVKTVALAVANKVAAGAQWLLNAAMLANPIGLIIAGVIALIAVIVLLVKNWDKVINVLKIAWEWIKNVTSMIWEGLCNAFKTLLNYVKNNSEKVLAFITIFTGPFGMVISIIKELKDNWGAVVDAFKTDGLIAGFKKLGSVILSAVLAPIQGLLEILAKIPGVDKLLGPAVNKIQDFRNSLKGTDIAMEVRSIVPPEIDQVVTATSGVGVPANITPNINRNNQTVAAATTPATRPMTAAEQFSYSQTTHRENVDIAVRAEQGTSARLMRPPRSPNVTVAASGSNR